MRQETLPFIPGHPVMLQICVVPATCYPCCRIAVLLLLPAVILHLIICREAYALSIHKTQSLSIKHIVRGCLEERDN